MLCGRAHAGQEGDRAAEGKYEVGEREKGSRAAKPLHTNPERSGEGERCPALLAAAPRGSTQGLAKNKRNEVIRKR